MAADLAFLTRLHGPQHDAVPCAKTQTQISHGGSQGFKSPHLHPQTSRSERRQRRAGGAHCMLRPRCGRKLKSQCSPKALRGQPTQAQASHNDHAAWSPPAASRWRSRAHPAPLPVGHPGRRPSPSRPSAGPARPAPASSARLQPRADDAPSWTWRATTPTPAIPAVRLPAHRHTPRPHSCRTQRTPERTDAGGPGAGHWTPERSDVRTGHRSRGQAPMRHRTLAPDTGHRTPDAGHGRGHGDDSTAGIRASLAATPSDRTLRRAPCLCSRTTSRLLGRFAGPAAPRRIALLGKWFGVRVERRVRRQVLWRRLQYARWPVLRTALELQNMSRG